MLLICWNMVSPPSVLIVLIKQIYTTGGGLFQHIFYGTFNSQAPDFDSPQQSFWKLEHWGGKGRFRMLDRLKKNKLLNAVLPARVKHFAVRLITKQKLKQLKL